MTWLNLGQILKLNAKKFPRSIALKDRSRSLTYPELNDRVNKLANALLSQGLKKGDKVAVLLENCFEIVEVYLATAKTGLVIVPVNFRLIGKEIQYIVDNSDAKMFIVHDEFTDTVDGIKSHLNKIRPDRYLAVGRKRDGYVEYEKLLRDAPSTEVESPVGPKDIWAILYTSGTTGVPKGVVRSHESYISFYLINAVDFGFSEHDYCLNVMPIFHVNSTFFTFTFLYIGGSIYIHPARSFRAEEILKIVEEERITFISLIPTHYSLILNTPEEARKRDFSSLKKLLCSSAPASQSMKKGIMAFFPGVELYEGYGSTEAGIVTVLKPKDQLKKLGSIGFESLGTEFVKILDEHGNEVKIGEVGELYSKGPMLFNEYYKLPEKTVASFKGGWFSAGDMAKRDEDGFFYLVDRKANLIITGGEHVYPSEVENVIAAFPACLECAVIGLYDSKWGEAVTVICVLKDGVPPSDELMDAIKRFCDDKLPRFKIPKRVLFICSSEMPKTTTGKIVHRLLRERFNPKQE